jgi:DNA mismatch endonuclease (patch repair protein)
MADIFSRKKRSEIMSKIRGSGNKDTELAMISILRKGHITGWRRHQSILGKPDFTFSRARLLIFVDGCFWHSCSSHSVHPKNNKYFWKQKLEGNKRRDRKVTRTLRSQGWHVLRIWEHELSNPTKVRNRVNFILSKSYIKK